MGHLVGKDLYRALGAKIDGLTVRAPWDETLFAILKELYSSDEARLIVGMPSGPSSLARLTKVTGMTSAQLEPLLAGLADRGLVMDILLDGKYRYLPSPMVIGIFEFTMMRTGGGVDHPTLAKLFNEYIHDGDFFKANFGHGEKISLMRSLPYEGAVAPEDHVEVLDYEKATAIIEASERFAMGLCACRHTQEHLGQRTCRAPLDNCSTLGVTSVDFMVRHKLAREVDKSEMIENMARSRELGLVLNADNVQHQVGFICHCCGCCCGVLRGISRHGYPNTVVTSNYIASSDRTLCKGCGVCSKQCPIAAIPRVTDADSRFRKHGRPQVDEALCLGCGVCTLKCRSGAMKLHRRPRRVFHPENLFERLILQSLERGTLENLIFDDPSRLSHAFLRALTGGFLRLNRVKQALMGETLRSRFLGFMSRGTRASENPSMTEM